MITTGQINMDQINKLLADLMENRKRQGRKKNKQKTPEIEK